MKKRMIFLMIGLCGLSGFLYNYTAKKPCDVIKVNNEVGPKRRKFLQNKLWRDRAAIQLEEQDGAIIHRHILNDEEYSKQLGLKLREEAEEVQAAQTQDEIINEIGDVLEVLDCMIKFHNISRDDITAAQDKKRHDRGSYLERQFVTMSEYLPGSFGERYSLKEPGRYVEILD